uniref:Uncharacterized protein n=1 Tax=Oryza glumipatula TaxID=40148 RepID=A0A0D9ZKQ4_9ORYZ
MSLIIDSEKLARMGMMGRPVLIITITSNAPYSLQLPLDANERPHPTPTHASLSPSLFSPSHAPPPIFAIANSRSPPCRHHSPPCENNVVCFVGILRAATFLCRQVMVAPTRWSLLRTSLRSLLAAALLVFAQMGAAGVEIALTGGEASGMRGLVGTGKLTSRQHAQQRNSPRG